MLSHLRLVWFCLGCLGHLDHLTAGPAALRLDTNGPPLPGGLGLGDGGLGHGGSSLRLLDTRPMVLVPGDDRLETKHQDPKLVEILLLRGFFLFVPDNRRAVVRLDSDT